MAAHNGRFGASGGDSVAGKEFGKGKLNNK